MKSKQITVFNKIRDLYYPMIEEWYYPYSDCRNRMEAFSNSPEEYHHIANAANKYWELIDL